VAHVAESTSGALLLWVIAIGLLLYVGWRLMSVVLPAENSAKVWLTRLGYLVSALTYTLVAWTAISFARAGRRPQNGGGQEDAQVERFTQSLLERSAGRWLVGLIGVAVIVVGVFFGIRAFTADFRKELEPGGVGPVSHESIVTLGRIGWAGRALMMLVVGWFVMRAAVMFDADQAKGIDGALREATGSAIGSLLVGVVAVALIVYGAYCVISAPRERLRGAG
jgi:hypothetical protein